MLANAFETISKNSEEYEMIQEYKSKVNLLNKLEQELNKVNQEIRDIRFGTKEYDGERVNLLEGKAKRLAKDITKYDKRLLNMEASAPLRRVIQEERKKEALEEERRLCFVAMTRARWRLYLTESEGFGVKGFSKVPSRFLTDLPPDTYRQLGDIPAELRAEQAVQAKQFDKTAPTVYRVGDQIRHKAFGEGIVESVDEKMRTYYIRFVNGVRPISFDYNGIAHIF